jgi:hypothetical protein
MLYLKKNITTAERNADMLKHALESYNKHQLQLQGKGLKIATVLEILAEQAEAEKVDSLTRLAKILVEKETARSLLTQRIQGLSIEVMAAYPV